MSVAVMFKKMGKKILSACKTYFHYILLKKAASNFDVGSNEPKTEGYRPTWMGQVYS